MWLKPFRPHAVAAFGRCAPDRAPDDRRRATALYRCPAQIPCRPPIQAGRPSLPVQRAIAAPAGRRPAVRRVRSKTPFNQNDFPSIQGGFPHSEIHGSKLIRSSPRLIAAYHVLHRLCMPRHPPNALLSLDRSHCQCSSFAGFGKPFPRAKLEGLPNLAIRANLSLPCGHIHLPNDKCRGNNDPVTFYNRTIRCHRRVRSVPHMKARRCTSGPDH